MRFAGTSAALASQPDIAKIAFTGSTATGHSIALTAAQYNRKFTLELGGKSPNLIFPSADFEQASEWATLGGFENSAQACSAGSRVLVHRKIKEEVEERSIRCAKKIKIGHPLDPETWQGPQVSQAQFDSVMSYVLHTNRERTTDPNFSTVENATPPKNSTSNPPYSQTSLRTRASP
ncbi:hypothetical protein MVLG_05817 [Microbotryum lychnidis-dioicae p1A1 Lamole]|uniref:Aldehyde dehydrogenase domain-containing protein n=1 Tax=Microbotryum lychnidis-dioicae (strain p1A1 Lamole / MvSl-1064) TaxID=683840 RepID=U5HFE0_USTV1|nr:hypothetical protein MVLG_05817 [Microbotryum lychnidis-dioicae p1A1 Lamole]|eukprot:KDE03686.1 hypothetical protein MVLG_05817 [Microbotryum lychnidis-dioicae p1A1 Lamole]